MGVKDKMELEDVAFIGRTYAEYMDMFAMEEKIFLDGPVLDCPAGPSSFTAEACARGHRVTACDMLYNLPVRELEEKGNRDIALIGQKLEETAHLFRWNYYGDKNRHMGHRVAALSRFVADYPAGVEKGRYVRAELPHLPFADNSFALVISSHFFFLYGERLGPGFHVESLKEMARVSSGEVRVYPLIGLDAKPYPHMDEVLLLLERAGIGSELRPTPFEFFKGADMMLAIQRTETEKEKRKLQ